MSADNVDWKKVLENTSIIRFPKQKLATFGSTSINYYVVTEPLYTVIDSKSEEGVIRTGVVVAEKPAIITPYYAMHLQGFSEDAYEYFKEISSSSGQNSPGILYQYKNEPSEMEIVSGNPKEIAANIDSGLDKTKSDMSVVMIGVDEYWDVALLKFVYEFTANSIANNINEFSSRGLLDPDASLGGIPRDAVQKIEKLFSEAEKGGSTEMLKLELDRWGVFEQYQDRFFNLFKRAF
tara:strand:- start:3471 stop:4178 length:708 start_codon:yes stop_codon:yes gene_type:complete